MASVPFLSLVWMVVGCALGAALGALFVQMRFRVREAAHAAEAERLTGMETELATVRARETNLASELETARIALGRAESAAEAQRGRIERLETDASELRSRVTSMQEQEAQLRAQLSEARMELEKEREQAAEKLALLTGARVELTQQFENLANRVLEEKSQRFARQNQENLEQVLAPLRNKLQEFQGKVEQVYVEEGKDRVALKSQVEELMKLNQRLSADASDLTQALKGSTKTQGNWGEVVLERVLEASGLRKGHEYKTQASYSREDGTRAQPDVIIHLPEGKHLVVDAKVSLLDYNDHVNCEDEAGRAAACARHLQSVRGHVKGLSERNYQLLYGLETLDFVVMFVPVEPAFMLAISRDASLWTHAWERNVLLVSPSTILFVVRTVAHLWRQEQQTRSVGEIVKKGGELYDKFSSLVTDLEKMGERLRQAQESYDAVFNKLKRGRGNLVNRAQELRALGVQPTKPLPEELVRMAAEEEDEPPLFEIAAAAAENGKRAR